MVERRGELSELKNKNTPRWPPTVWGFTWNHVERQVHILSQQRSELSETNERRLTWSESSD